MKILVYGVTHWDGPEDFNKTCCIVHDKRRTHIEWYNRVCTFIPNADVFLTTGTYSDPRLNPLPVELIQIPFKKVFKYTHQNNFFRNGFMTGIWKALLDCPDFDLLIHCQVTRYLGTDLSGYLQEFMNRPEQLFSIRFTSGFNKQLDVKGIDVGFMAMKKNAALMYAVGGLRQSCDRSPFVMNCEEEAYLMFKTSWWNPWPQIPTVKQIDTTYNALRSGNLHSWGESLPKKSFYDITDIDYFKKLPIIANSIHVTDTYLLEWLKANPYEK